MEEELGMHRSGSTKPVRNEENAIQEVARLTNTNQQLNNKIIAMQTALDQVTE